MDILGFYKKYAFLSNFYQRAFVYKGICFRNSGQAFQYAKVVDEDTESKRLILKATTPDDAKYCGRHCTMRADWEDIKISVMYDVVKAKFEQNKDLKERLINTGDSYLEETNKHDDDFWGCCPVGQGQNNLGKILMKLRDEFRKEEKK